MRLHNREGTAIDPVPFLVVSGMAFAIAFSYGPMYFATLGLALDHAVAVSAAVFVAATAAAYHRFVWDYRPARAKSVPAEHRLRRLVLAAIGGVGLLILLALPLI